MTNKALTTEQYDYLNTERESFNQILSLGYCKNLHPKFLDKAVQIHINIFGMSFNKNCPSCCKDGLRRLATKMNDYDKQPV